MARSEHPRSESSISSRSTGIAHDLRNILSCIRGYAQLLLSGPSEKLRSDALSIIEAETGRCCGLLEHMLRPGPEREPPTRGTDAARAVSDVCGLALGEAAPRGVELSWSLEPGLTAVALPEEEARRVLLNLVRNGLHAAPRGGRVEVRAKACRMGAGAPGVEIAVSDTGRGIPKDALVMLFEPFYSTRSPGEGVGLGLAISKEIVSRFGGAIEVESAQGRGATFTVRLPAQT